MISKRHLLGLAGALLAGGGLHAAELDWLTDLAQAQTRARAEHKLILADFTGSDWCIPCAKQHRGFFRSPAFAEYARANLVLLKVDFPAHKKLPAAEQAANARLKERFRVQNFPTLLVLNAEGEELKRWVGYSGGGASYLIKNLNSVKARLKPENADGKTGRCCCLSTPCLCGVSANR